ncbi:MAG: MMPL family transporter [Legionellales bacterium]|nr:MMPL family transporter [Legionellales bacterium]
MNLSAPFIARPVATTLLAIGTILAGILAFNLLPVSPLPQIDFPTILIQASLPGGSPETMASAVATPLERKLGNIAGVTNMTSTSLLGSTRIIIQFDLSRDINGAARDVQAAINAARANLPSNLPSNPTYRKVNPADAPIMILSLTSDTYGTGAMYDVASSILQQKLSQVDGVGQVNVGGSSLPAVRIELNPTVLNKYGIGLDDVSSALAAANVNVPKGELTNKARSSEIISNDQLYKAADYQPLIITYRNNSPVRISDVADVSDSVQDIRNAGLSNGKPAVILILFKEPGANVIKTVGAVRKILPVLNASIPAGINMNVIMDSTATIKTSLHDVEATLLIAFLLVILVTYLFLGSLSAMIVPGIAVLVSLLSTFGVMLLLGYSLDNLSLMALTISTGFVVDDVVVVLENISRHLEMGENSFTAALNGAREVGFTVLAMSLSLIAVFIPILLMSGIVGRLFREFAVTLSIAIFISLLVSLTLTPMMCSQLLKPEKIQTASLSSQFMHKFKAHYEHGLTWALGHPRIMLFTTLMTIVATLFLFVIVPKGFFPQQDTGRIIASIQGDQDLSFQAMKKKLTQFIQIVQTDPGVENVVGFIGGQNNTSNAGTVYIILKPLSQRKISSDEIINRLRKKLVVVPGATLYMQSAQDINIGGRATSAQYQYTLSSDNLDDLNKWAPLIKEKLSQIKSIVDLNTDQLNHGLQSYVTVDRNTASKVGLTQQQIDTALYSAFGQRQVSTMYTSANQYHVVMEVAPRFWQYPETLQQIYVKSPAGAEVPLAVFTHYDLSTTLLSVNHQGLAPAATFSFNLLPNIALGEAVNSINAVVKKLHLPSSLHGTFQGTAQAFQQSLSNELYLILAALAAVYIILGMLYESLIHPVTILSTLPSAGVGALLALLLTGTELSIISIIGIILLIGIVKKNAIMMIDVSLHLERTAQKSPKDAIYEAALMRFRPIMMTTCATLFGALPLVFGFGLGSELRQPLGIAIVGGLLVSQVLTLFTTPVIYLYFSRVGVRK